MKTNKTCSTCRHYRKRDDTSGWCWKDSPDSVLNAWVHLAEEVQDCWKPKPRKK